MPAVPVVLPQPGRTHPLQLRAAMSGEEIEAQIKAKGEQIREMKSK